MFTTTMVHRDPPTRDEEFYFEDGSCIFQVRDRLFNLHRSILSVNSVFFKQIFSLPQPTSDRSGRSDEDPILCDDPVDDFRALCHVLYRNLADAGPESETLDAPALIRTARIASLAHKYEFSGVQKRAHKVLSGSLPAAKVLPVEDVSLILDVALECSWENVVATLGTLLLNHISRDRDNASLETASNLSSFLELAQRHDEIKLQAAAYYQYLVAIKWTFNWIERPEGEKIPSSVQLIAEMPTTFRSLSALDDGQKHCLFHGFMQLSSLKVRLRVPPLFSHSNVGCVAQGHQGRCEKRARAIWEEICVTLGADIGPIEILSGVQTVFSQNAENFAPTHPECVQALIQEAAALERKLGHKLHNYFGLNLKKNQGESIV